MHRGKYKTAQGAAAQGQKIPEELIDVEDGNGLGDSNLSGKSLGSPSNQSERSESQRVSGMSLGSGGGDDQD